jgi:hypothetical protein
MELITTRIDELFL